MSIETLESCKFITTSVLAKTLGVDPGVVQRAVKAGDLVVYRIGKEFRILESEAVRWINSKQVGKYESKETKNE